MRPADPDGCLEPKPMRNAHMYLGLQDLLDQKMKGLRHKEEDILAHRAH